MFLTAPRRPGAQSARSSLPPTRARFAALCLFAAAAPAFAFQPFITDDTGTQGSGGNQFEVSYGKDRTREAADTITTRATGLVFTRGFTDTLDVFVQANRTATHSAATGTAAEGSGNPSFGAKWRFYESDGLGFALKPEIVMPVSAANEAAGLGSGRSSGGVTFIATQETGFGAVHANLFAGRERFRDPVANPDARTNRISVAPVWNLGAWQLGVDLGRETVSAAGERTRSNFVELGAVYSHSADLDFAAGLIRNAVGGGGAVTRSLTLGVTWRF